jgi:hypothetical protein
MTDIGTLGDLEIYLSTNAFKVQAMRPATIASPLPQPGGTLTLTGLGGSPLTIQVYSLGVLITPGLPDQVWTVPDFVTAALTISGYWTYDGLYDAGTGAWEG